MAMTLDKLFNFDEQTLARQVMNEKRYAQQAASDASGWGGTVAGFSRLTDNVIGPGGMLGAKDPILEEKALVETAFANAQNNLTPEELADPTILYTKMLGELQNVGASSKYTMGLSKMIEEQKNELLTAEGNAAYKQLTVQNAKAQATQTQDLKERTLSAKKEAEFNKYFNKVGLSGDRELTQYIESDFPGINGDAKTRLFNQLKTEASEEYRNGNMTAQEAIAKVSSTAKERFDFKDAPWYTLGTTSDTITPKVPESPTSSSMSKDKLDELLNLYK